MARSAETSMNYKKKLLVKFQETESQNIRNFKCKHHRMLEGKVTNVHEMEIARTEGLKQLACLINMIKAKKLEVRRKELEIEKKREETTPVQYASGLDLLADVAVKIISKMNSKKELKTSIKKYHTAKKLESLESTNNSDELVSIGPNGTKVTNGILKTIDWESTTSATRGLLMAVFDRKTLAFHTLTGKRSPAFADCDMPIKNQLDPSKVSDIIHCVTTRCKVPERDVKMAITTKCADENKMYKQRQKRKSSVKRKTYHQ